VDKKKLQKELANQKAICRCAKAFGVVGDETRLKICYLLRHYPELSVSDIAEAVGLSISAASRSLKKLKELRIVKNRRESKQIFYSLGNTNLSRFIKSNLAKAVK
jgi:DNA-binding transcriptional ArsR family regulator